MHSAPATPADPHMDHSVRPSPRLALTGLGLALVLAALSGLAAAMGSWKIFTVSWVAFVAMAGGGALGAYVRPGPRAMIWGYGLTSGAMLTSASLDLIPMGVQLDSKLAGVGIAGGLLLGYLLDSAGRSPASPEISDTSTLRLTAHTVTEGVALGGLYTTLPGIGILLGLTIISHKGPAGYAVARRLASMGRTPAVLVVPAAGLGIPALVVSLLRPDLPASANAVIVGLSAGVFLHFAFDFLPAGEHTEPSGHGETTSRVVASPRRLALSLHGLASTVIGGTAVALALFLTG